MKIKNPTVFLRDGELFCVPYEIPADLFKIDLEKAKSSAVRVKNREDVEDLMYDILYKENNSNELKREGNQAFYTLTGYEAEVKKLTRYKMSHEQEDWSDWLEDKPSWATAYVRSDSRHFATITPIHKEEESQEEIWTEAQLRIKSHLGTYSNDLVCDLARWAVEALQKDFTITRKLNQ